VKAQRRKHPTLSTILRSSLLHETFFFKCTLCNYPFTLSLHLTYCIFRPALGIIFAVHPTFIKSRTGHSSSSSSRMRYTFATILIPLTFIFSPSHFPLLNWKITSCLLLLVTRPTWASRCPSFNMTSSNVHHVYSDGLHSPDLVQVYWTGQYWDFGT
jgi:hypothetical protein